MRKRVRLVVAAFFYYSGLVALFRWRMQQRGLHLIILNYHRANHERLRQHMLYLRRYYRVMHLEEALEELYMTQGKPQQQRRTSVVITFDDGYHDNYTHAFALAKALNIPMTVFLVPDYMGSDRHFWWLESNCLLKTTPLEAVTIEGQTYDLHDDQDRRSLKSYIDKHVFHASSVAEREDFLQKMRVAFAVPATYAQEVEKELVLTWEEARKMQASGLVSFGGHTMHHPILSCLTSADELEYEVSECRDEIARQLGQPIAAFAYPVGRMEHIGNLAPRMVKKAGYRWAVTTIRGFNTAADDPLMLKRVPNDVSRHWLLMACEISGIWQLFAPLWKNFIRDEKPFA